MDGVRLVKGCLHKAKPAVIGPIFRIAFILAAGPVAALCAFAQEPEQEMIRMRLEALPDRPLVDDVHVADGRALAAFYEQRAFRPAWSRGSNVEAFVSLIAHAEGEGLKSADYHWPKLAQMLSQFEGSLESDLQRVDLDLLLTDALLRYAYHLRFGKVDPARLNPEWNLSRAMPGRDTLARLQAIIDADDLEHALAEAIPRIPYYWHLKQSLRRYRTILEQGAWATVPSGPPLKLGMMDARVRVLRDRLGATGELGHSMVEDPRHFDQRLEGAVVEFQVRHGLATDGVVGPETLAALNVSVSARIDQLRVNMERARWIFQDIEDDYLLVNIAAFEASLFRSGARVWSARTVVGKPFRKTPVFKSKITYLVFNPRWFVPPTILREDLLPRVKKDPGFLHRQNMKIINRAGRIIDPYSIAWDAVDSDNFPYTIGQDPGANNAMGKVKFMLPNPYFVYLHDTPDNELFERTDRSFSSGCIRVENVIGLAEHLLDEPDKWDARAIASAIDSGRTQTVTLARPMTTMVLYWTNEVDAAGKVYFSKDVYERDQAVLEALDGPFVFSPPEGFEDQFPNIR